MRKKILRLKNLFLHRNERTQILALVQNATVWVLLISSLLASCSQKEKHQSLLFEEQGEQIAVSTEDYAMTFVEDEVAIKLPTGQSVAAMNVETSTPILEGNKVIYEDIADQTDLIFYDKGTGKVGYDIQLKPHAKIEGIKIPLPYAPSAFISRGGELVIPTTEGQIKHSAPIAYQEIEGARKEVDSKFVLEDGMLSFEVESYDENYALVIDPEITYEAALILDGSTVTITSGSPIVTGTTATVNFQVTNNAAPLTEYIYRVLVSLPSGWTVACNSNDATDSGGAATNFSCITGSTGGSPTANAAQYTGESPSFGEITGGNTWNFSIDVTVPNGTATGDYNFTYTLTGDGFGNPGSIPDVESGSEIISVGTSVDPNVICVNVFRDYNSDGTDDGDGEPAISSAIVTAYDAMNNATVLTNNNDGTYTFTPGNADTYRIEVTGLTGNLEPSVAGATTTFFMSRGNKVEVGLNEPAEYYPSSGVFLATPCYVEGGTNGANAGQDVMVIVAESSLTGGTGNVSPTEYFVADHSQIGSTFGIAHSRAANSIFAAAFTKRHTAFGPGGTGAIYKIDLNGDAPTPPISSVGISTFLDLNALFGADTTGIDPHPNGSDFDRDPNTYDEVGKVGLGGLALSETENVLWTINLADRKLYEIPLGGTRENPTAPATSASIGVWPASGDLTGLSGLTGTASDIRPFAVKCHKGEIYIGMVNTAESTVVFDAGTNVISNTGDRTAMRGFIYKFNPNTDTFTKLLEFPLDYARGQAIDFCSNNAQAEFYPWSPIFDADVMLTTTMGTTVSDPMSSLVGERAYPQAWITDIEFDEEGKMLIGIRDRFADQHGYDNPPPSVLENVLNFTADGAGDILVASINTTDNMTYVLESNSANGTNGAAFGPTTGINKGEGPDGGEFFFDDRYRPANATPDGAAAPGGCNSVSSDPNDQDPILDPQFEQGHDEICTGGIFHYNGKVAVYLSAYDPINDFNNFNNAGLVSLSTSDGSRQGGNQIYATTTTNSFTFAKGNGLGDVGGVSGEAPLQVGNRLWLDANVNGRQDPNEDGINGVLVELFKETAPATFTKVAETTTAADAVQGNGFFVFSDNTDINQTWVGGNTEVLPGMNYEVRVALAAVQAQDGTVVAFTSPNTNGVTDNNNKTDLNDSDASSTGVIAFTTGLVGENNHTLDIGATSMPPCILTINSSTPDATCSGGTYDVDFALTWTDAPTTGDFEVSIDGGMTFTTVTRTNLAASGSETISLTGVTCDGAMKSVQIRFADATTCLATSSYTAPVVIISCDIDIENLNITCADNGFNYTLAFDVTWDYTSATSETVIVELNGTPVTGSGFTPTMAMSSQAFSLSMQDPSFGNTLSARFSTTTDCDTTILFDLVPSPTCVPACMAGNLGGTVFNDFNNDGVEDTNEAGQGNILVYIYECDNAVPVDSVYTNENGEWSISGLSNYPYRVEFSTPLTPWLEPSAAGADNGTDVQFVDAASCEVDFGVIDSRDFCHDSDPLVFIPCYESGTGLGSNTNNAAVVAYPYSSTATDPKTTELTIGEVGSVWGSDYDPNTSTYFVGSLVKRHIGMRNGTGAVFFANVSTDGTTAFSGNFNLQGVNGLDFGTVCRDATCAGDVGNTGFATDYELSATPTTPTIDLDAFDKAGKTGIGGIAINGSDLWLVNLNSRSLVKVDISDISLLPTNGSAIAAGLVTEYPINAQACTDGVFRPFAIQFEDGVGYIGGVCTAENVADRSDRSNLDGYVYSFDPSVGALTFTEVLNIDFDYTREKSRQNPGTSTPEVGDWRPWASTWAQIDDNTITPSFIQSAHLAYPQPIISSLAFTESGSMVIGVMDRWGNQTGANNRIAVSQTSTNRGNITAAGDILFACKSALGFQLEGSGGCTVNDLGNSNINENRTDDGPSGMGEYFYLDDFGFTSIPNTSVNGGHHEVSLGGVTILKGTGEVLSSVYDPFQAVNSQGIHTYNTATGNRTNRYEIVASTSSTQFFAKAAGLGRSTAICGALPIQVGNYVWNDVDMDGIQDACEMPIPNLVVKLYDDAGLLIGQDTTDTMGEYYFDVSNVDTLGITVDGSGAATPNTGFVGFNKGEKYFIVFMGDSYDDTNDQITVGSTMYELTTADSGEGNNPDQNDSDVSEMTVPGGVGNMPVIMFTADSTDHTFDAGLIESTPILGAIGNYVWLDENSDGLQDAGEPGIPNVKVVLKDMSGNPIDSTLTAPDGSYLFPDLPSAMYFVDVDETTLPDTDGDAMTQDLTQTTIFTNVVDGSDADTDNDDGDFGNKDHSANGGFGYKITLDEGEENLTADFGYNYNPTDDVNNPTGSPVGAIGDQVWYDADQDGVKDPEEVGVEGVTIKLIAASEVTIGMTTYNPGDQITTDVTDANGFYLFDGLPAGAYNVMVMEAGSPIDGYTQTGDPDHFAEMDITPANNDGMTTDPVVLGPGDVFLNVDFGYDNDAALGSIGDYVWLDFDADGSGPNANGATGTPADQGNGTMSDLERPIEGVTVALIKDSNGDGKWDEGEPIIASDVTDENGLYYFPGLPTGMDADYLVLVTDTDNILDGLEPTFDGDNNGETMPTDNYPRGQMANMELGLSAVMDLGTTPVLNQDFGYTPEGHDTGEGLIGDYVWYDNDSDGVQDPEESGIEGVKVYLLDDMSNIIDSTFTDENGYYYFGGLPVDMDYQVTIADDNFDPQNPLEDLKNTYDPDDFTVNPNSEGGIVMITTARPIDTIQDFGFVGDDVNPVGSLGNKIFNDVNANGVRDAGEMGFNGVTIDLYRDLNSNGELDPGEPKIGSTTTATVMGDDGMYLFENLPIDSFIVDVTDINGVLAGYWHTDGSQDPNSGVAGDTADDASGGTSGDNSKTDAFSVGLTPTVVNNLNVDFGYYKDPAAVGNYVWEDTDGDGQQDVAEPGIEDVVVSMMVTYPDGTMITLTDTTDANGFYEFPNLLIDEDYRIGIGEDADMMTPEGTGVNAVDPSSLNPSGTITPLFVIKVEENQAALADFEPTLQDETTGGITDADDSDAFSGVVAVPVQGKEDTDQFKTDGMLADANAEEVEASYDFGAIPIAIVGAIGNYVWLDDNSDGLQDAGEPGIPNVKVVLKDVSGNPIDSTLTAPDGSYLFPDLPSAMYFVDVDESTLPNTDGDAMTQDLTQTTIFTNVVDGSDVDTDNDDGDFGNKDHSANGGFGYKITLDPGEENLTADFGYNYNPTDDVNNPMGSPLGALGDRVWYDADQDGVQDPEEAGVEGVTLKLIAASDVTIGGMMFSAGDQIAMDVTDATGFYLFDGLPSGAYNVMVADDVNGTGTGGPLDGYTQTGDPDHFAETDITPANNDGMTTDPVLLGPGDVFLNVDFGYDNDAVLGSIGDYVWLDADADGNGPNANGATGTPINQGAAGEDDSAETPIEGVAVILIKDSNGDGKWDEGEPIIASDKTDADGLYYFPGLPTGSDADYLVLVTDTDNVLDGLKPTYDGDNNGETMPTDNYPSSQMANMELGLSAVMDLGTTPVLNQDFGYTPDQQDAGEGLIGDYVWYDTDSDGVQDPEESGIEGVVMELYDLGADEMIGGGDDVLLATTTTDENGYYYFPNLPVDMDGEGYQVKVAESTGASGEDNFAAGEVLEGLVNTFDPNDMITNPDDMGGVVSLTTADPIDLDQDFGYVGDDMGGAVTLGSIGNQVWEDFDADGVYEPNGADGMMGTADDETPLAGVTIDLYRDLDGNGALDPGEPRIGTTTTDANGMYLFDELPLDDYIVDVTDTDGVLAGYWHSTGNQDASTNMGNDAMDNSKEDAFAVTIDNTTPDNLNVDFGYYKDLAAVGNYVWEDLDADGIQDGGEPAIEDVIVTMEIIYPDGTMITLTDTTDANGFYEFPNLLTDEDYNGYDDNNMGEIEPVFNIFINTVGQDVIGEPLFDFVPTQSNVNGNANDLEDAEPITGVDALPVQGNENTAANADPNMEDPVASYDFGFTEQPLYGIGGTIWEDQGTGGGTQNNGVQDGTEPGIKMVTVYLLNDMDMVIDSMLTGTDGTYLFEGLPAGDYRIQIPSSNFGSGSPLESLPFSSVPTNQVDNNDTDNNDDGAQFTTGGVTTSPLFTLGGGTNEPEGLGESQSPNQDGSNGSMRDMNTNTTVDLGFQDLELPVELLAFQAKADKDHIDLVWSTASEFNNSHFELERSEDGKVFKQIAKIEGQGTTLEQADYSYDDTEVVPGVLYYYRLKQVDFDGVFEYSEVRTAELEPLEGGMELYPNPIGDATELQVRFYTTELTKEFVIMDMQSRSVLQVKEDLKSTGWNTMSIDIRVLPAGTYLILDKEGNSMQFIKTRE